MLVKILATFIVFMIPLLWSWVGIRSIKKIFSEWIEKKHKTFYLDYYYLIKGCQLLVMMVFFILTAKLLYGPVLQPFSLAFCMLAYSVFLPILFLLAKLPLSNTYFLLLQIILFLALGWSWLETIIEIVQAKINYQKISILKTLWAIGFIMLVASSIIYGLLYGKSFV